MNIRRFSFVVCVLLACAFAPASHAGLFSKKQKAPPIPPPPPPVTNTPPPAPAAPAPTNTPPAPEVKPELSWDAKVKEIDPKPGDPTANTFFTLTNTSTVDAVVTVVRPSCGCTTAKVPPLPWTIGPGQEGRMDFSVNLAGKSGTLFKTISIESTAGNVTLQLKVVIPDVAAMRESNRQMAMGDRQAVLKGDCMSCHVTPAVGKTGAELYKAACAICHDSEHRATMVPDLHNLPSPTDHDFWKTWTAQGKPGSLMPGFAKDQDGGFLTDEQIESLADYLTTAIPSKVMDFSGNSLPTAH